jgi:hypothetical protein
MESFAKYYRLVFATAFQSLLEWVGHNCLPSLAITGMSCLVVVPWVHGLRFGWEAAYWEIEIGMSTLMALPIIGSILFVVFLAYAPVKVSRQLKEEVLTKENSIQVLRNRVQELEERLKPKLAFVYAHYPPYEDIKDSIYLNKRQSSTFRIGVKNIGGVFLSQCSVILEPAANPVGGNWLLSKRLKLQTDDPFDTLNMEHKQSFSLAPGQQEIVEVLTVYDPEIKIWYAKEGHRDHNLRDILKMEGDTVDVIFNLRAVAEIGDSLIDTYCLKINRADNAMQFGTLTELAKANQLEEDTQDTNS